MHVCIFMSLTVPETTSDTRRVKGNAVNKVEISFQTIFMRFYGEMEMSPPHNVFFWVDRDTFNALPA